MVFSVGILAACSTEKSIETKRAEVDEIFAGYQHNMPGAAVMVIEQGNVLMQAGYGLARVADQSPVTAQSNFRLASITKQFTAMSILQLIDMGQLTLDTTLTEIFPNFPDYGQTITIEHILAHSSGIKDYGPMSASKLVGQFTDQDVLDYLMTLEETDFNVGEQHVYSNSAYVLLTKVVEKITATSWPTFVQSHIFTPLGMHNTVAFVDGVNVVSNRAYGHTVHDDGSISETDQNKWSALLGDGGIYSNLTDFYHWDQALYTNKLLSQPLMTAMFTNHTTNDGMLMNYGYGWRIETYKGLDAHYHTGSSIGFRNIYYRIPAKQFSVVIFSNRDEGGEYSQLEFAHKIVDVYFDLPLDKR